VVNKKEESQKTFLFFLFAVLFLRDAHLDHVIDYSDRIGRNVDNGRHLHSLSRPDIELASMARTDNVIAFNIAVPHGSIVVGTDISYSVKLASNIENHQ